MMHGNRGRYVRVLIILDAARGLLIQGTKATQVRVNPSLHTPRMQQSYYLYVSHIADAGGHI
jgi:hypothetical protein